MQYFKRDPQSYSGTCRTSGIFYELERRETNEYHQETSSHAQVRRLTVCAMLTAIIWLLTISPIGFTLPFFGISMTFNHIPMIIGTLMEGLGVGCVLGAMFGLSSMYSAFTRQLLFAAVPEPAYLGSAAAFDRADNLLCV